MVDNILGNSYEHNTQRDPVTPAMNDPNTQDSSYDADDEKDDDDDGDDDDVEGKYSRIDADTRHLPMRRAKSLPSITAIVEHPQRRTSSVKNNWTLETTQGTKPLSEAEVTLP